MDKRFLYRGQNDFQGSIDEDGNLYDENHRPVGRIVGNDVYDYCNIKQGTIGDDGKLWDNSHNLVGQNYGNVFMEPSFQGSGFARGDITEEGHAWEYGALMLLKKRNRRYAGEIVDNNYNFSEESAGECEDEEGEEIECREDVDDDYEWRRLSQAQSRPAHNSGIKSRSNKGGSKIEDAGGCAEAIGGLIGVIVFFIMICNLVKACWNGEIYL